MRETLAEELFDTTNKLAFLEEELWEYVYEILGLPEGDCTTLMDIIYDSYDASFELKGAKEGLELTEEQLQKFWAIGFYRGWICYREGPTKEKYYQKP